MKTENDNDPRNVVITLIPWTSPESIFYREHHDQAAEPDDPDTISAADERELIQRARIWQAQEAYLIAHFGDQYRYAELGWGSSCNGFRVAESAKVFCKDAVYILSSRSLCATPELIEHELLTFNTRG